MMRKSYTYKGSNVIYDVKGGGEVLVFLHGYLESRRIWDSFITRFENKYKVILLDIPGHGESSVFSDMHSMEELALVLKCILEHEQIKIANIIGHSMGGYLTMSFAALYPEMVKGFCLFHSTCFADNEEKKKNRDREIEFIKNGKKSLIVNTNIPYAFADDNLSEFSLEIDRAKEIALSSDDTGIISLLEGMKGRKDYSGILKDAENRALLVWGAKDNYIVEEVFEKMVKLAPDAQKLILKNAGHMGFIEEAKESSEGIISFLDSLE